MDIILMYRSYKEKGDFPGKTNNDRAKGRK